MTRKHKKVDMVLNYIEHLLISVSTIPGCDSISDFASLVSVPLGVTTSAVGSKICVLAGGIKKCK